MKTNHQRNFVERKPTLAYTKRTNLCCARWNRYEVGKAGFVGDVLYDGHQGFARAVRAIKTRIRRSERRSLNKRLRLDHD